MSRIEKNQPIVKEMEQMEDRLAGAVRHAGRPRWKIWAAFAILAIVLGLVAFALWTVAATGLVRVPLATNWAYERPLPSRVVGEGVPFETAAQQQIAAESVRRAYAGADGSGMALSISETTLTTELRDALETSGQSAVDASSAQVSVSEEGGVELFLPLRDNAQQTALTAVMSISVDGNGTPVAKAEDVSLGSWHVPGWLRDSVVNPAVKAAVDGAFQQLPDTVVLKSIRTQDGSVAVTVDTP